MIIGPEDCDNTPVGKGKYAKLTPKQISDRDPQYLIWMYREWSDHSISEALYKQTLQELEDQSETEEAVYCKDTFDHFIQNGQTPYR